MERPAFDQLHDDVGRAVDLSDVVDGDDVGMVELGGGLRLVDQSRPPGSAQAGLAQHLDRHLAIELLVAGAVDGRHSPAADLCLEIVPIVDHASRSQAHRLPGVPGLAAAGFSHTSARKGLTRPSLVPAI